jgi:hypothetical protein
MNGQNNPPTLTNTEFAMDRGNCLPSLLFNFLLTSGGGGSTWQTFFLQIARTLKLN